MKMEKTWNKIKETGKNIVKTGKKTVKACMGPIELYRKREAAWRHLRPYKKEIFKTIAASVLVMLVGSSAPFILGWLIDNGNSLSGTALAVVIGILYAIYTAKDLLDRYVARNKEKLSLASDVNIRCKANDHLSRMSFVFRQKNNVGGLEERIDRAGNYFEYLLNEVLFVVVPEAILCVVVFFLLYTVNYLFSVIIAVTVIIYSVLTLLISETKVDSEKELRQGYNNFASSVHDTAINFSSVKSFEAEDSFKEEQYKQGGSIKELFNRFVDGIASMEFWQRNIMTIGTIMAYALVLFLLREEKISIGNVVIVLGYVTLLTGPFSNLARQYGVIKRAMVNFESVNEILDEPEEPYGVGEDVGTKNGKIEIKNLSFTPTDGNETLNDVNIKIPEGPGLYTIVGESGSGKTTLWKILLRYLPYCTGKVSFGGTLIEDLKISSLRKHILSVERTTLFSKSIRDNVKIGNPNASDEMVKEALRKVRLDYLTDCLDRVVGPSERTSNGENQRIQIARIFVNDTASIVFADEPTQALDPINSDNIMKALKELSLTKKVIVITHDLIYMTEAKKIFVMEKGRMIEEGTHKELMKLNKKYAEHFVQQTEITKLLGDHTDI